MTYIAKAPQDEAERAKWRVNAEGAAKHLKSMKDFGGKDTHVAGFVFDDGIVKLPISVSLIQKLSEQALTDWIFETILNAQKITLADGESAGGSPQDARGTDVGHAAAPVASSSGVAAVSETCKRRLEPHFTQLCPNPATGGLRITLRPSPAITKRWGMHSMLTFVMDLTVCASCFQKVQIMEITDQALRARLGKSAQQMNNGVLVDWKETLIEHVPFDDPQLAALRTSMSKREQEPANDGGTTGEAA